MLRIIYNRVPKCGSTTVHSLLEKLAFRNKYTFIISIQETGQSIMQADEQRMLADDLFTKNTPWIFTRHMHVLNFTRFGTENAPKFINVIRDPVERKKSEFYYANPLKQEMSFDECVEKNMSSCIHSCMMGFFCGYHEYCSPRRPWHTLNIAKQNVLKYYGVVGIMEDMNSFFQMLEFHYPQMFSGALAMYRNSTARNVNTKFPNSVKESTRLRLKELLMAEYDFYGFVKQRLHEAKQVAGLISQE